MSFFLLLMLVFQALASPLSFTNDVKRALTPSSVSLNAPKFSNLPYWTTTVTVNGRKVVMMVDTRSADFWLHGPNAPPAKGGPGAKLIKGEDFSIAYGSNSNRQEGLAISTTVGIGTIPVPDFVVGTTTHDVYRNTLDGIMGLAFKGLNSFRPTQQPTLMEAAQKYLHEPVFTISFKPDSTGDLQFGVIDKSKYKGDLVEAEVNNKSSSWTVDSITLSSGKAKVRQKMLFDTGAADIMLANQDFVDAYWHQVRGSLKYGSTMYIFPCSAQLPDMQVGVDGKESVTIRGAKFKGKEVGYGACVGLLQAGSVGEGTGTMGGPFWLSTFVVFNQAKPSISFANQS